MLTLLRLAQRFLIINSRICWLLIIALFDLIIRNKTILNLLRLRLGLIIELWLNRIHLHHTLWIVSLLLRVHIHLILWNHISWGVHHLRLLLILIWRRILFISRNKDLTVSLHTLTLRSRLIKLIWFFISRFKAFCFNIHMRFL